MAIDTVYHHSEQLEFADFGLAAAALAEIDPSRIVNFMSVSELREWVGAF
jgi:hypothetical protein